MRSKHTQNMIKIIIGIAIGLYVAYFGFSNPTDVTQQVLNDTAETYPVEATSQKNTLYKVLSVTDGDTFKVSIKGVVESVRVLGINTPETKYSNRGVECFGAEASSYATTLLENTSVQLTSDDSQDTRDKYGRLLAYVTLPDGRDFGQVMIADGYAYEYTFKGRTYKNQDLYKAAQTQAQEENVGLWADGGCENN